MFGSQLRVLTLRPSIRVEDGVLVIKTGMLVGLFTLFLRSISTEIRPVERRIVQRRRLGYFFTTQTVLEFDDIRYLDYGFGSFGTEWGWSFEGWGRQDQVETFYIDIVSRDDERLRVCAFRGEGAVMTGWGGVLLSEDSLLDVSGTQEGESRQFVNYLAKVLDVPVGQPIDEDVEMATCPACNRSVSLYNPKCLYCGAEVNPESSP